MRTFLVTLLAAASCATLRADFSYQDTTQITGGALYTMLRALGPFTRGAREPIVSTHLLKGNRMASISKDHTTIIDLDKETITEIDTAKKSYSVVTFAQMKQAMEDAVARAKQERAKREKEKPADAPNVNVNFKVSANVTGQSKNIGVLTAKETVLTMTMEGTNQDTGQSGAMNIVVDSWLATVPGYDEVKEFHRKLGEKVGYAFASGMSQIVTNTQPESLQGFAEAAKELNKVAGVPVQSTTKMGGSGDPSNTSAQPPPQQSSQNNSGSVAGAAIGRLAGGIGGFGRKKNNDQPKQTGDQQQQQQQGAQSLVETTTTLDNFSSGPVDAAKFEVPAAFKQVDPDVTKRRGR